MNELPPFRRCLPVLTLVLAAVAVMPGCSVRKMAIDQLGAALAEGSSTWASDDDLELVRDATPFALKTMESLIVASPDNRDLLLAAASGFTQYTFVYVHSESDYVEASDLATATAMRARAKRLYRRALGYGLRGLEVSHPGFGAALRRDGAATLAGVRSAKDVPLLYWTGAAWGALISLSKDEGEVSADLPLVEAMLRRALELDATFGDGALWDFFISLEGGKPVAAGGSPERARAAFDRAVAISGGRRAAPYVGLAESVCVGAQDRAEFLRLLDAALAVDPDAWPEQRLANLVAQKRARWLKSRADELFIE